MASAFAVASKRAPLAGLLKKLLLAAPPASGAAPAALALRPASLAAARRLFSTRGAPSRRDDDDDESSGGEDVFCDVRCCRCARDPSTRKFPAEPMRVGSRLVAEDDDDDDDDTAAPRRAWWVSKEDDDAVQVKVAMPGVAKEHVKVWADKDGSLMIKGECAFTCDYVRHFGTYIGFPMAMDAFKMDKIKAEMKDGVLTVTVPKIKLEDRKDVFNVKVE